jgi:hypothetical protein
MKRQPASPFIVFNAPRHRNGRLRQPAWLGFCEKFVTRRILSQLGWNVFLENALSGPIPLF